MCQKWVCIAYETTCLENKVGKSIFDQINTQATIILWISDLIRVGHSTATLYSALSPVNINSLQLIERGTKN